MTCRKCSGKVIIDTMYEDNLGIDIYCLRCGARRIVNSERNEFGRWLKVKMLRAAASLD